MRKRVTETVKYFLIYLNLPIKHGMTITAEIVRPRMDIWLNLESPASSCYYQSGGRVGFRDLSSLWLVDFAEINRNKIKKNEFQKLSERNNDNKKRQNLLKSGPCRPSRPRTKKKAKRELSTTTLPENNNKKKKLWNMKVSVIPIVIGVLETISKRSVKGLKEFKIRGRVETILTTVIPIVVGELGTIPKGLAKGVGGLEIRGQVETIRVTVLLKSARIPRIVLETWGDLLSLRLQWEPISWHWCDKLARSNIKD